jgi:hypothetical protein
MTSSATGVAADAVRAKSALTVAALHAGIAQATAAGRSTAVDPRLVAVLKPVVARVARILVAVRLTAVEVLSALDASPIPAANTNTTSGDAAECSLVKELVDGSPPLAHLLCTRVDVVCRCVLSRKNLDD